MQNVGNHSIVVGHNTNEKVVVNEKSVEMLCLKLDLILEKLNNIKNNIDRSINMIAGLVLLVLLVLLILLIFGFDKGRRIIIWLISGTICLIILIIIVVIVGLICLKK